MWQFLVRNILLVVICCGANFAHADSFDNNYQVDVIIFEHSNPKRFATEHWPKFVGQLEHAKAFDLDIIDTPEAQEIAQQEGITAVTAQQMLLKADLAKIKTNKNTRFIQAKAWRQVMITGDKSTPIYFTDGSGQEIAATFVVKPMRNNIFNLNMDLIYKLQDNEKSLAPGVNEIRVSREIKLKKKEVYYIDHPVIGVLVMIAPVASE